MESILRHEISRRVLLAAGCFALLIFVFSPPWAAFAMWTRVPETGGMIEVRRATSVLFQMEHLGAPVPDELHGVVQWRLLPPLVMKLLPLPLPWNFGLAHLGCIAVLAWVITIARRNGLTFRRAAMVTLLLSGASWFFTSVCWLGYFDSWLVFGLLLVAFTDSRWTVWIACALTPWVDERFVLAAPLALMCRSLYRPPTERIGRTTIVAGAILLTFLVVRLGILSHYSGANATAAGYVQKFARSDFSPGRLLLGVWTGWRVAWVLVLVGVAVLWRRHQARTMALLLIALTVTLVGLGTAQDLSRSMMLLAPVVMLGALETLRERRSERALPILASISLLLPAHHVMSNHVAPIYYLYHELAAFDSPPPAAMPELHELKGILAMQRGEYVAAAEALSLAIKLARNPAGPSKQRGVLFASQQQWKEARDDFAAMVQHEPRNPDGWFLRAQAELALGNRTAAATDFREALAVAGPGWTERADVARFRAKVAAP